jgi:hypothetical protein
MNGDKKKVRWDRVGKEERWDGGRKEGRDDAVIEAVKCRGLEL